MTPDIDALEGAELDKAVAEARGWTIVVSCMTGQRNRMRGWSSDDMPRIEKPFVSLKYIPSWSSSIADAWELVDEMCKDASLMSVTVEQVPSGVVCVMRVRLSWDLIEGVAPTAPAAICKAYLRWRCVKANEHNRDCVKDVKNG